MFKYFEIFKENTFRYFGKEPDEYGIPSGRGKEGGKHEFLMKLRASKLKDDALIESFMTKLSENYDYPENYYNPGTRCVRYPRKNFRWNRYG